MSIPTSSTLDTLVGLGQGARGRVAEKGAQMGRSRFDLWTDAETDEEGVSPIPVSPKVNRTPKGSWTLPPAGHGEDWSPQSGASFGRWSTCSGTTEQPEPRWGDGADAAAAAAVEVRAGSLSTGNSHGAPADSDDEGPDRVAFLGRRGAPAEKSSAIGAGAGAGAGGQTPTAAAAAAAATEGAAAEDALAAGEETEFTRSRSRHISWTFKNPVARHAVLAAAKYNSDGAFRRQPAERRKEEEKQQEERPDSERSLCSMLENRPAFLTMLSPHITPGGDTDEEDAEEEDEGGDDARTEAHRRLEAQRPPSGANDNNDNVRPRARHNPWRAASKPSRPASQHLLRHKTF